MERIRLGRTGLEVTRTAFGVLPLQRVPLEEAARILRRAYEGGINFFDTARAYTDSEEKIGYALSGVRDKFILATKSGATDRKTLLSHLETSLRNLRTDHVDILQLHNPDTLPDPDDPESAYAGLLEARAKGMTRFIGITNHSLARAQAAVDSGLYDTMQFPLCSVASEEDLALAERCRKRNVGLIAMKPLSGGLLTNARAAFAFLYQYTNVVPIWGIQRMSELEELLAYADNPPALDAAVRAQIEKDRKELAGNFCRGCGYCLPCPEEIPIPVAARIGLLLRRAPFAPYLTPEWQEKMQRIENCRECGQCRSRCPYGLDTPRLLKEMLLDYQTFYREHK